MGRIPILREVLVPIGSCAPHPAVHTEVLTTPVTNPNGVTVKCQPAVQAGMLADWHPVEGLSISQKLCKIHRVTGWGIKFAAPEGVGR